MPSSLKENHIDLRRDVFAVLFLALGIFFGLCLVSYSPTDPALSTASDLPYVKNFGGIIGAYIADFLLNFLFGISAYLTSLVFILMGIMQYLGRSIRIRMREFICYSLAIAFTAALIHLKFETVTIRGHDIPGGGIIGGLLGSKLVQYLNRPGAFVVSSVGFIISFTLATRLTLGDVGRAIARFAVWSRKYAGIAIRWLYTKFSCAAAKLIPHVREKFAALCIKLKPKKIKEGHPEKEFLADPIKKTRLSQSKKSANDIVMIDPVRTAAKGETNTEKRQDEPDSSLAPTNGPKILKRADLKQRRSSDDQLMFQKMSPEGYEPPPLALLDAPERKKVEVDENTLKKNSLLVEKKVKDFDVEGKVVAIHPGPVITMYEFEPSAGTKVNKIVNLQDDLSLTLGGRSVRIIPHLPGKAALGIEIPNSERETVWLKDILSSPQFVKTSSHLPLSLGSSTSGHSVVADLTKMPHLLVAGATGSGKSVAINSMILSILYKSSPADVRFILVDPKMLELSVYDGIPHLLLPVVTKPKPAVLAMRWAIREMERRYGLMADTGTRNILGYNEKIKNGQVDIATPEKAAELLEANKDAVVHTGAIPYIVIVIDELADLMMTASQDMEEAITRLAQMARASGIHLILATQRPSVDVITGLIKANFPARMAFKVTAKHDSRTILDGNGAETLLGNGDMLFMTPQGGNLIRIHGSYVTDSDISRVVAHLKNQGEPVYDESITAEPDKESGMPGYDDSEDDELYDQAVKIVAETKQASISMVQRRLRIGYNRAARLIERMEAEGVVGPADGAKPRQVLVGNNV